MKESFIKPCITTQRDFIQNNLILYFDITRISLQISFISKRLTTRANQFPHETFRATRYIQTFEIIIKLHIVPSSKKNLESLDNLVEKQMHPLLRRVSIVGKKGKGGHHTREKIGLFAEHERREA